MSELELAQVLWRDLARPLGDFLSGLSEGPREAIARWAAVEAVLAEHGLEAGSTLVSARDGRLVVAPSRALADPLLRALGEVLGSPLESHGDALVRWRRGGAEVTYRLAAPGEELALEWTG